MDNAAANGLTKVFPGDDGDQNYGFASWPDQGYRYTLRVPGNASSIKIGFGVHLSSAISDESWGIDNLTITEIIPTPVPAMSVWGLGLLAGLLGLIGMRRRMK